MRKILIVYHSMGGNTKAAAELVAQGARALEGTRVQVKEGLKAGVNDLLSCDGIAVGTPDYFSYMAGGLKDFFDRTCYPTEGHVTGKPCAIFVTHGGGGKAVQSVEKLCRRFKFKLVVPPVLIENMPRSKAAQKKLIGLGKALAEASKK
jgi:multimeric flavodoxin WrbA